MQPFNREVTDNYFKMNRWLVESILAGVDYINFAFVTRKDIKDVSKGHQILATHTVPTKSVQDQLNLKMELLWRIINYIVNVV